MKKTSNREANIIGTLIREQQKRCLFQGYIIGHTCRSEILFYYEGQIWMSTSGMGVG